MAATSVLLPGKFHGRWSLLSYPPWDYKELHTNEQLHCSASFNLRNFHAVFHTGCTNIHSYQQCTRVPFSLYPSQHLFVDFLIVAIMIGMRSYLTVAFIFIYAMINNVKHLFMCLLAIYSTSLEKVSIQVFCPCLTSFFFFLIQFYEFLYILDIKPLLVTKFANISTI